MKSFRLRKRNNFNYRYVIIIFALLLMTGIGFAYVQSSFSISGVSRIQDGAWNVNFESVSYSTNMAAYTRPVIDSNKDSISFSLNLEERLDTYEFEVVVANDGEYDAMINNIDTLTIPDELKDYINYSITYASGDAILNKDLLKAGAKKTIKVSYSFKQGFKELSIPIKTYSINFFMPYVQATSEAVDR